MKKAGPPRGGPGPVPGLSGPLRHLALQQGSAPHAGSAAAHAGSEQQLVQLSAQQSRLRRLRRPRRRGCELQQAAWAPQAGSAAPQAGSAAPQAGSAAQQAGSAAAHAGSAAQPEGHSQQLRLRRRPAAEAVSAAMKPTTRSTTIKDRKRFMDYLLEKNRRTRRSTGRKDSANDGISAKPRAGHGPGGPARTGKTLLVCGKNGGFPACLPLGPGPRSAGQAADARCPPSGPGAVASDEDRSRCGVHVRPA
jgi:hypothetical protein